MKIFDISQEVFHCAVYPGDPAPKRKVLMNLSDGDVCNLTQFEMCAHNGTHVDAPYHFFEGGKPIDQLALEHFIGYAYVAEWQGDITAEGVYMLNAAPLNLGGADGAPCRAVLVDDRAV